MNNEIWVSEAPLRSENAKATFDNLIPVDDVFDEAYYFTMNVRDQNNRGAKLEAERFPHHIFSNKTQKGRRQTFTDFFRSRKVPVISQAAAETFKQFDMGYCSLFPVSVTLSDGTTPVGNGWYCLNYANTKETIIPEKPIGMMPVANASGEPLFIVGGYLKDDQLSVQASALAGADIWVDHRMLSGFFVSGRLAKAIKAAKLKGFYLSRCKLDEG